MTKLFKIAAVLVALVAMSVLIEAGIYMQDMTDRKIHDIQTLTARKDDMLAQQQDMLSQIAQLNRTLESATLHNAELSETLSSLADELNRTVSAPVPAAAGTAPAAPEIAPKPVVTRAS